MVAMCTSCLIAEMDTGRLSMHTNRILAITNKVPVCMYALLQLQPEMKDKYIESQRTQHTKIKEAETKKNGRKARKNA